MSLRTAAGALLAVPLATTLALPIDNAMTGPQLVTAAVAAMTRVADFHFDGKYPSNGIPIYVNVTLSPTGGGGTVRTAGLLMQIVSYGDALYLKGDQQSLDLVSHDDIAWAHKFANKWVEFPTTYRGTSVWTNLTRSGSVIHSILPGDLVSAFAKTGTATWDGRAAIVLRDVDGSRLYVADGGTPYVLHLQNTTGSIYYNFTDFGDAPTPAVPKLYFKQ